MQPDTLLALPEDWNTMLAIAAHPDDLEYGAASAIARWTSQGKQVIYLMVTSGEAGIDAMTPDEAGPLREQEELNSAAVVGVDTVDFMNYTDGVDRVRLAIAPRPCPRHPQAPSRRRPHEQLRTALGRRSLQYG